YAIYPKGEPTQVRRLSEKIPVGSTLFLGNSLPIRQWDLAADLNVAPSRVCANRGANGIDGLVASFLGQAEPSMENWLILGDLSALYDLNSLALVSLNPKHFAAMKLRIVVLNNGGGKIFSRMFQDPHFENQHDFKFNAWAELFGWKFQRVEDANQIDDRGSRLIIEMTFDNRQSELFWNDYARHSCLA